MAITSLDQIVAALPGQQKNIFKASLTTRGAGNFHSLWAANGLPSAGVAPVSINGIIPTNTTQGALPITNSSGANSLYLAKGMASSPTANSLIIYDRLWANATLNGTLTTAQTWTPPVLTRNATGDGVEAWIEVYASTGATSATATLSYTNSLGVAGKSATAVTGTSMVAGQMVPLILASGDNGIQTCTSLTLSVSSGVAGNFGITLLKRIATIPIAVPNAGIIYDALSLGLPKIDNNSAISLMILVSAAASGIVFADLNIIES